MIADAAEDQPQDVAGVGGEGVVAELIGWGERARGGSAADEGQRAGRLVQKLPGEAVSARGQRYGGAEDHSVVAGRGGDVGEAEDAGIEARAGGIVERSEERRVGKG